VQTKGNGSAPRKLFLLVMFALVLFCVGAVTPARASVTYDITVTPNSGSWSGSGTFTVSPNPSPTGNTLYDVAGTGSDAEGTVTGTLSVNLVLTNSSNTLTFSTAGASGTACTIEFSHGVPDNDLQCISLVSTTGAKGVAGGGTLTFDYTSGQLYVGSASTYNGVTLAYALVTPEPSTLLLWGTGLLALGAVFRKKLGVNPAV
jgi:hypothetical protein